LLIILGKSLKEEDFFSCFFTKCLPFIPSASGEDAKYIDDSAPFFGLLNNFGNANKKLLVDSSNVVCSQCGLNMINDTRHTYLIIKPFH